MLENSSRIAMKNVRAGVKGGARICICIELVLVFLLNIEPQSSMQGGRRGRGGYVFVLYLHCAGISIEQQSAVQGGGRERVDVFVLYLLVFLLSSAGREGVDWAKKEKEKRPLVKQKKCVADPYVE